VNNFSGAKGEKLDGKDRKRAMRMAGLSNGSDRKGSSILERLPVDLPAR
jgi:hypothetical protein